MGSCSDKDIRIQEKSSNSKNSDLKKNKSVHVLNIVSYTWSNLFFSEIFPPFEGEKSIFENFATFSYFVMKFYANIFFYNRIVTKQEKNWKILLKYKVLF